MPVVHTLAARLRPEADRALLEGATSAAQELRSAPGVVATRVGCSDSHLVAAAWLPDPGALEPFAASPPHMNFVMRGLAPLIEGMWSISVDTDRDAPAAGAASICALALPEAPGIFEWQVRRQLEAIDALPGIAWLGPTVEERERYRAGGVVLLDSAAAESFADQLDAATDDAMHPEVAFVPLIGDAEKS